MNALRRCALVCAMFVLAGCWFCCAALSAAGDETGRSSATLERSSFSISSDAGAVAGDQRPANESANSTALVPATLVSLALEAAPAIAACPCCPPTNGQPSVAAPCNCPECQKQAAATAKKKQAELDKAVATAYAGVFYNNNFSYINNPLYDDWYPGDRLKQMQIGDCVTLDIGGQYRARYHGERHIRNIGPTLGLTGRNDDFLLHRTRIFMNGQIGERIRAYAEFIDAAEEFNTFAPRNIEVNRADMLNLFIDYQLFQNDAGTFTGRIGRQELLYGSERLISPLDWANTRRTFEGVKFFWTGEDWNHDVFFTEPVAVNPIEFDSAVDEQEFFGLFSTYKGRKNETIDLYALQYNNALAPQNFQFTTMGARWLGAKDDTFLWEFEGGYQFGENTNGSGHSAGFATAGLGHRWKEHDWKPTLWGYYDWAQGSDLRGAGNGFNHLFPLAHKYLGFMDLFGRSNIESPNVQLSFTPHERWKVLCWYYYFFLENKNDTPYNVNMSPYNPGNTPRSADLGHEIDLLFTYSINKRMDILFGYSHFFAGDYYKTTPGVLFNGDADFYYVQYHWNF